MCLVIAPGTKSLRTCVSGRKSRLQMANNKVSCRVSHLSNYTEDFSSFFAFAFAVFRHCTLSTAEKFLIPQRIKRNSGRNKHNSGIINKNNNLLPIAFSSFYNFYDFLIKLQCICLLHKATQGNGDLGVFGWLATSTSTPTLKTKFLPQGLGAGEACEARSSCNLPTQSAFKPRFPSTK